jgi:hypothetical protein
MKLLKQWLPSSVFCAACLLASATIANAATAELKVSQNSIPVNQELTVTFSSTVHCKIQMSVVGLDDPSQSQKLPLEFKIFTPPAQYKFKMSKPGKYRVWAQNMDGTTCGNLSPMTDIVVTNATTPSTTPAPSTTPNTGATGGGAKPSGTPAPKGGTKPVPCKQPGKPGVGKDCMD